MNRKGIEIATGTIVVMIISIILFAYSIYFVWQIFSIAPSIEESITQKTDTAIQNMIEREQKIVALPSNTKKASIGQMVYYWAGIRNIEEEDKEFKAKISFSGAYPIDGKTQLTNVNKDYINANWLKEWKDISEIKIKPKEYTKVQLGLQVGSKINQNVLTKKGVIYVFNVCFYESTQQVNDCVSSEKRNFYPANQMFQIRVQVE